MSSFKSIAELGAIIHKHALQLDRCIREQEAENADPFSPGAPPAVFLPSDLQVVRDELEEAVEELLPRLRGPVPHLLDKAGPRSMTAFTAIHALAELRIPVLLGSTETCDMATVASRCSGRVDVDDLTRLLRAAVSHRIFDEPRPGFVSHNASSLALARDLDLQGWMAFVSKDLIPAQACMLNAMRRWPGAGRPGETGWSLVNARRCRRTVEDRVESVEDKAIELSTTGIGNASNAPLHGFFDSLKNEPPRAGDFSKAMRVMQRAPAESTAKMIPALCKLLTDNMRESVIPGGRQQTANNGVLPSSAEDGEMDNAELLIIDVGGSTGAVSASILRCIPHARAIVQDTMSALPAEYEDLHGRLTFESHNFFQEQPEHIARTADVYLLRMVLHDWDDEGARAILRALLPALKMRPGSRVIVNALCLPGSRSAGKHECRRLDEQAFHSYDLLMKGLLNGRERDEEQWRALIKATDPDMSVERVVYIEGSVQALIEIGWKA